MGKAESQSKHQPTTQLVGLKDLIDALEAKLDHASHGLAALKTLIDAIEAKLDGDVFGLEEIKNEIVIIDNEIAVIDAEVGAIEAKLDARLDAAISSRAVPGDAMALTPAERLIVQALILSDATPFNGADIAAILADTATIVWGDITTIDTLIDGIVADIGVFPTANYATLAAYVEDIRTRLIAILADVTGLAGAAMRGTDNAALAASWTAALATILGNFTALRIGYLDQLDFNLQEAIAAIQADVGAFPTANYATLAAYVEDIRTRLITLLTSVVPKATDEQDSFNWDTSAYLTNETDISALFTTPLTGATRRRYSLFLDLTQAEADAAAWTKCTIKIKVKINPAAYVTVDKKIIAKTDVATAEEPGINIDIPALAKDCQVTMQFDVALAGDATIYYHYVTEVLE